MGHSGWRCVEFVMQLECIASETGARAHAMAEELKASV